MWRCLALTALGSHVGLSGAAATKDEYEAYLAEFGKDHVKDELPLRRALYEERLAWIAAHNSDSESLWTAGVNEMTDLFDEERASRLGHIRGLGESADSAFGANAPEVLSLLAAGEQIEEDEDMQEEQEQTPENSSVDDHGDASDVLKKPFSWDWPRRLDWREVYPSVLTAVKNQGACGSCWAFTAAEELESMAAIATGILHVLSPQAINSCSENPQHCGGQGGCMGSTPQLAYNWTMVNGVPTEWKVPYMSGTTYKTGTCFPHFTRRPQVFNSGWESLPTNNKQSLLQALVTQGPIGVTVATDHWFEYQTGIFDGCSKNTTIINHAVQLVGFGRENSTKYWLVRNSWGARWGEAGHIRLRRYNQEPCSWDTDPQSGSACDGGPSKVWVCGECGILYDTSYPTGVYQAADRRLSLSSRSEDTDEELEDGNDDEPKEVDKITAEKPGLKFARDILV